MSFIYEARRWSGNFRNKLDNVSAKFAQYVTSQLSKEGEDITIITEARLAEDILKYCDEDLTYSKMMGLVTVYPPEEPDGNYLKLYVHGDSFGDNIPDYSMYNHHMTNRGILRIQKGIDIGNGGSYELVFDGRSCAAWLADHADFRLETCTVGFSSLFRFQPFLVDLSGGKPRTIIQKKDPSNDTYFGFDIQSNGSLLFYVLFNNTQKRVITPPGLIVPYGRYEVAGTFDVPTLTAKLYVNNVEYTASSGASINVPNYTEFRLGWHSAFVNPPAGEEYPLLADSKLYCGALQSVKFWREKVLTAAQVGYHYTNKLTIANLPFGQVAYPGMSFAGS